MPVNLQALFEAVNSAKTDSLKPIMSPELMSSVSEGLKHVSTSVKNLQYQVGQTRTEGNNVAFTYTAKGTAANGQPATWTGSAIATLEGNTIVDLHVHEDYIAKSVALGEALGGLVAQLHPSARGTWNGSASGISVTLHLTETARKLTGNATVSGFSGTFPVTGQNNAPSTPNVKINATIAGLATEFEGDFNGQNEIDGSLTISGFPPLQVALHKAA